MITEKVTNGSLQPAETEIVVRIVLLGAGEVKRLGIPAGGQSIHHRAGRVGETQQLADLVEAFSRCVIQRGAQNDVIQ